APAPGAAAPNIPGPKPAGGPAPAAPKPTTSPIVPVKKETSKVQVAQTARPAAPQATVKLGQDAPAAAPKPEIKPAATAASVVEASGEAPDSSTGVLAIAAALVALAALGIQVWMFL
ncbi:MAG: hypothetical protein IAE97_11975, partial [Chthoniobacterales bacterium]|nr:hypothetical protein [Chthoniobacterales bacterium]